MKKREIGFHLYIHLVILTTLTTNRSIIYLQGKALIYKFTEKTQCIHQYGIPVCTCELGVRGEGLQDSIHAIK